MTDPNGQRCGFFEESPGVRSSTRLFAAWLIATGIIVALGLTVYILRPKPTPDAGVLAAGVGIITALVASGAVAIINRSKGD